ncbi:MAG TPA: CGNR zinc finger domain-containing protein [Candidatus Limnocylindrales bacterium]|nr:CGNR zinc finger domain-containing protein [Candidatus Limnocylindrales bacterium]
MITDESQSGKVLLPVQQGHLARLDDGLDFVNTLHFSGSHKHTDLDRPKGPTHDHLRTPVDALDFLVEHDLLHASARDGLVERYRLAPEEGEHVLGRLRRLRQAMRGILETTVQRQPPSLGDLNEVNRAMRTHYVYELVPGPDGVSLEHRHQGDPVDGAMARLAESLARELIQGQPERLRICDNPECGWVFSDRSRTGRRRWCDMATCGNRAKVARHRARQKLGFPSALSH